MAADLGFRRVPDWNRYAFYWPTFISYHAPHQRPTIGLVERLDKDAHVTFIGFIGILEESHIEYHCRAYSLTDDLVVLLSIKHSRGHRSQFVGDFEVYWSGAARIISTTIGAPGRSRDARHDAKTMSPGAGRGWHGAPRCELSAPGSLGVAGAGRRSVGVCRGRPRPLALLYFLCCTELGPSPRRLVTPDRSGVGSACRKATVYRFVTTEAGVEHTFAAGQSG